MDENIQSQQPTIDSNSGTSSMERRPPLGEDPAAMTIEFLRARLLSERSVSKAARQHAHHLAKKVLELERRLESEIQLRDRFESVRLEALSKYKDELISDYGHFFVSNSGEEDSDRTTGDPTEVNSANMASGSTSRVVNHSLEHGGTGGESALQSNHFESEEGASTSRMANFEVRSSSRQGSFEEDRNKSSSNDEEEIELTGREKGILAWGRRKGERRQQEKERGQITELFGRTSSQKSLVGLSADGESPQKRWIGKSVRQIRKKEDRCPDTNSEDGPCQIQEPEDVEGKISNPEVMKGGIQCDADGDTEVERVLERQAELIERFEAEENAQMAWEEKFRQETPSSVSNSSDQDSPPKRSVKEENNMVIVRDEQRTKEEACCKQDTGGLIGADDNISNQLVGDVVSLPTQKVHHEDSLCENAYLTEEKSFSPSQNAHKSISEDSSRADNGGKDLVICATNKSSISSDSLQGHGGPLVTGMAKLMSEKSMDERQPGTLEEPENNCSIEVASVVVSEMDPPDKVADLSHKQALPMDDNELLQKAHGDFKESQELAKISPREASENQTNSSNTNIQGGEMHMRDSSVSHEGTGSPDLCNKQLSSFKFSASHNHVSILGDVGGSSHQLLDLPARVVPQGDFSFALIMPNAVHEFRSQGQERLSGSGDAGAFSASEFNQNAVGGSCCDQTSQILRPGLHEQGLNKPRSCTSDRNNVMRETDTEASVDTQKAITQLPCGGENDLNDGNSSHASSENLMRDSPWEEIFRRRMRAQDTGQDQAAQTKNLYGFTPYPDHCMQQPLHASARREGIKLDNSPPLRSSRAAMPDYFGLWGYGTGSYVYQDEGGRINPRKSVDGGFDRVTDVLRVLQIAKNQIQSSDQSAKVVEELNTAYNSGDDGREGFPVEPTDSYPVLSQMNLDGPTTYPAPTRDGPPPGYLGPRLTVDNPYAAGWQVPPQFSVPGPAPYYSSLYGRGLKPFMPGPAAAYARSPSSMQHSIPWAPQGTHNRNVYHHDPRNHR